jgi:cytochrome P450
LLLAGHETTTNLIGNATLALADHPDQADWLREDGARVEAAVEELLRFDSPVQAVTRVATEQTRLGDRDVAAGDPLLVLVGAANRDPDRFEDPDRLDLTRDEGRHLSFGLGPHFCLGAPLARLEGAIALRALLRRFPELRVAESGTQRSSTLALRGLSRLELVAQ